MFLIPILFLVSIGCNVSTVKAQTSPDETIPAVLRGFVNVHPRLYMTDESRSVLKARMGSQPYAALLEKLKLVADKKVLSGPPSYRPGTGYDEQLWQREVGNAIPELAIAYCMTGVPRYLHAARDYMLASASYPTWGIGDIDNKDLATGEILVLTSKNKSKRFVIDTNRKDKSTPLFVEMD